MPSPATPCQEPLQKSLSFLFCPQRALLTSDHTRRCIPPNLCHGVCYGTPSPESHHRQRAAIAGGIHIYRRTYTHAAMQSCLLSNSPTKRKPPAAALPFSARPSLPSSHEKTAEIALIAESIPGGHPCSISHHPRHKSKSLALALPPSHHHSPDSGLFRDKIRAWAEFSRSRAVCETGPRPPLRPPTCHVRRREEGRSCSGGGGGGDMWRWSDSCHSSCC